MKIFKMHFQCRAPTENYKNGISRLSKLRKHLEHMRRRHDRHGTPWQPGADGPQLRRLCTVYTEACVQLRRGLPGDGLSHRIEAGVQCHRKFRREVKSKNEPDDREADSPGGLLAQARSICFFGEG